MARVKYEVVGVLNRALRGQMTKRELAMIGFSKDTKELIIRMIEANPAMEEAFIELADYAYNDGLDAHQCL